MEKLFEDLLEKYQYNTQGNLRKVGVEVEYSNLSLDESAEIIKELLGGAIQDLGKYKKKVVDTKFGDFNLELDAELLQKMDEKNFLSKLNIFNKKTNDDIEDLLQSSATSLIPYEFASAPMNFKDLQSLEKLVYAMRIHGALGTTESVQYAFGVHFNIEPKSLETGVIISYFKSFLLLQKWIEKQSEIDLARKITPFINDYPKPYLKLLFNSQYRPIQEEFIHDYIKHNPTRNRALDMLPLLSFLDEERVKTALPDEKINTRPTFHYRLPNSKIDLFRWNLKQEFKIWLIIELLVDNPEILHLMSKEYEEHLNHLLPNSDEWIKRCHQWVIDLLSQ